MMRLILFMLAAASASAQCIVMNGAITVSGASTLECTAPHIQFKQAAGCVTGGSPYTCTTAGIDIAAGDVILAFVMRGGATVSSMASSCPQTWTTLIGSGNANLHAVMAANAGTNCTFTVTFTSGGSQAQVQVVTYSGVLGIGHTNQPAGTNFTGGSGNCTTGVSISAGAIEVAGFLITSTTLPAYSASVGTLRNSLPAASHNVSAVIEGDPFSVAGAGTNTFTWSGANTTAVGCYRIGVELLSTALPPPPPPPVLSIVQSSCPPAIEGHAYNCTLTAHGGTTPYVWSSSGTLPTGLSRTDNVISGTTTALGITSYTMTVTDSAATPATQSVNLSINVLSSSACGPPAYPCARTDLNTVLLDPATTIPPPAGSRTQGGPLQTCVAGDTLAGLSSCGANYGINTIITEPAYNAQITRITDLTDEKAATPCTSAQLGAYAGGNVFDTMSNYFVIQCQGGDKRIKWFNPATAQVVTSGDPQGYVHCSVQAPPECPTATGVLKLATTGRDAVRASYITPGKFYQIKTGQVQSITITNGVASAFSPVLYDFTYGVPCWRSACPDWPGANTGVQRGVNIVPLQSNDGNCGPSGASLTDICKHSFQLVNETACTTGMSYPNFNIAFPQAGSSMVIPDGTCQWTDMGPPLTESGAAVRFIFTDTAILTPQEDYFSLGMSNMGGQDAVGACFGVGYDVTLNTYYHLNTCTGNQYKTTCAGGTGYACTGGTLTTAYMGNIFVESLPPTGYAVRAKLHNWDIGQGKHWHTYNSNYCALKDTSGNAVLCTGGNIVFAKYWFPQSFTFFDSMTLLGVTTPGHTILGNEVIGRGVQSTAARYKYVFYNVVTRRQVNCGALAGTWCDALAFDLAQQGGCQPASCMNPTPNWDQHSSWVLNHGSDNVPVCMQAYWKPWPWQFPFLGEVVCYDSNGSNRIMRQANTYNTQTRNIFSYATDIGSMSQDGHWWLFSSDWFCTLGSRTGTGDVPLCGFPFQLNHDYSVGELVGNNYQQGNRGLVWMVTTAGHTSGDYPGLEDANKVPLNDAWCTAPNPGCTFTNGGVTFTLQGASGQLASVFIVKLQ